MGRDEEWIELLAQHAENWVWWSDTRAHFQRGDEISLLPPEVPSYKPVRTVCQFYHRISNGGVERSMASLANRFSEMGYTSVVACEEPIDESSYELSEEIKKVTIPPVDWNNIQESIRKRYQALAKEVRSLGIDAFVCHTWLAETIVLDRIACAHLGVRFVMVANGIFTFPLLYDRNRFFAHPYFVGLCDSVVVLNQANYEHYSQFNPRVHMMPNPVSPELEAHARMCDIARIQFGHRLLWVGRFDPYKRPEDAIEVFARVKQSIPDATLTMVGKSEDGSFEPVLKSLAEQLNVDDSIRFIGYVSDPWEYYLDADILLSTSISEGFCMVLLEASAAGLPVAMYQLEYLPFDSSGGVVSAPRRDVQALADCAIRAMKDVETLKKMSAESRACYEQLYAFDFTSSWFDVFNDAVEEWRTSVNTAWSVLIEQLDHMFVSGERQISSLKDECVRREEAARAETRDEYENSRSYRLGRTITELPRRIAGRG